ncbi:MAG: hybrid sensor histidine kinase/response regulator [Chloroflexi bacterium]|nr:hybrid sensor histidine kinase/response regulator [Chloroflexota bacterium]
MVEGELVAESGISLAASPRVLVVDDEEPVVVTVGGILELDGYEVITTTSVTRALELIQAQHFDVVLTDLRMDDADGSDVLKHLREVASDETAAIVLTGYASLDSAIRVLRQGAYDYLVKPCDVLELRATVARAVERSRLAIQLHHRVRDLEQANETIRALNLELEVRVERATAELREQLTARDEFMSTVSHDLKTPLTFIKGMASLRRRRTVVTPENEALVDAFAQIEASAGRMAQQLDELVDASRLEAGRAIELRRVPTDLIELARNAVDQHQQATNRHALYVSTQLTELVGTWDSVRLARVLDNLLDNAVKYSPRGGTVEVCVWTQAADATLSVADHGVGIPEADLPHIFERFRRGRNVEGRIPGSGIGLAGVQRIVELHGGTMAVESQVGEGTKFTLRLPLSGRPA